MLALIRRAFALAACAALLGGCGRIGLSLVPGELNEGDFDAEVDEVVTGEVDSGLDEGPPTLAEPDPGASGAIDAPDGGSLRDAAPGADAASSAPIDPHEAGAGFTDDAGLARCGGASALGLCWYLGAATESCQQTCGAHGGFDARATNAVGTTAQGGSLSNCKLVMEALGHQETVLPAYRIDGRGLGCHFWSSSAWWLRSVPRFSPTASASVARIACACLE